ncbi:MAG: hypothetical protein ACI3YE_02695 [Candidatus Avispirillum sp.]
MKKKLVAAVILLGTFFLSACSDITPDMGKKADTYFPEAYQVKNYTDGEVSAFGLNIAPAEEMGDWVVDWLTDVHAGDGYQYFVYSDPDSWDVYLYYPNNHSIPLLTNDDVAVNFSDGTLKIYVTENIEDTEFTGNAENWILHFAANPRGVWPTGVELYWNNVKILCDAVEYDT